MQATSSTLKSFTSVRAGAPAPRRTLSVVRCQLSAVDGLKAAAKNAALAAATAALLLVRTEPGLLGSPGGGDPGLGPRSCAPSPTRRGRMHA